MIQERRLQVFSNGRPGITGEKRKTFNWKTQFSHASWKAASLLATLFLDPLKHNGTALSLQPQISNAPASQGQSDFCTAVAQSSPLHFTKPGDKGRLRYSCRFPSGSSGFCSEADTPLREAASSSSSTTGTTETSLAGVSTGPRRGRRPFLTARMQTEGDSAETGGDAGEDANAFDIFKNLGSDKVWPCACKCHKDSGNPTYIGYISGSCTDTPQSRIDFLEECGYPNGLPRMPYAKLKHEAARNGMPAPVGPENAEESPVNVKAILDAGYPEDCIVVVGDTYRVPLSRLKLDHAGQPLISPDLSESDQKDLEVVGQVIVAKERSPGDRNFSLYELSADDYRKRGIMGLLYALNRIDWKERSRKGTYNNKVTLNISWPEVVPSMAPEWDYYKSPCVSERLRRTYPGLSDHFISNRRLRFVTTFEKAKCACRYRHHGNSAKNPTLPLEQIVRPTPPKRSFSPSAALTR